MVLGLYFQQYCYSVFLNLYGYLNNSLFYSKKPKAFFRTDVPPPTLFCAEVKVENESQLVTEFEELLQFYPEGISITHTFGFYTQKYQKPLPIQEPAPLIAFFEKHCGKFRKWKKDGNTMVALRNYQPAPSTKVSKPIVCQPPQDVGILTGARPKVSPPQRLPTPEVVCHPTTKTPTEQLQWAATDIRLASPTKKTSLQTITVAAQSPTSNPTLRKVTPVSVRVPQRDGNLPATFGTVLRIRVRPIVIKNYIPLHFFVGVPKPKIKNVCEPGTEIERQELPSTCDKEYFFIIVGEVYSPGEFYWFLSENRGAIEGLTDDMT